MKSKTQELIPMVGNDWKPSTGQKFQLAGMLQEAAQEWQKGHAGMAAKKLEQAAEWAIQQVAVIHEN